MTYYYLDETADFEYTVRVQPGPMADDANAIVHKQRPDGPVAKKIPLQKKGSADLNLDLSSFQLEDSPLFIEFVFTKNDKKFTSLCAASLAKAVPAQCAADPTAADTDDSVKLQVTGWSALAYDRPGAPTEYLESKPDRVSQKQRSQVKWQVDGKDISDKGDQASLTVTKDQKGKQVPVEAYAEDKPPGRATCQVDCRLQVKIVLKDLSDKALAQTACVVTVEGDAQNPTSDQDGLISFAIPKNPVKGSLHVNEPPPSLDLDIPIIVGKLGGADTARGQQARLRNLGYYFGPIAEDDDDQSEPDDAQAFPSAVEEFQCDQGLPVTGQVDGATQQKLQELHGC